MKSRNFKATLCIKITIALLLHKPESTAPSKSSVPNYDVHATASHPTKLIFVIAAARTYILKPAENCDTKNVPARFQALTAVQLRPSLFWDVTRPNIPEERRTQQGDPFDNKMCSQLIRKLRVYLLPKNQMCWVKRLTDCSKVARHYSYNESQRDSLFLRFIWWSTLHVSDMSSVHHQEYLNIVYTQYVFAMLVLLAVC
jgi:hypothetical protein